ncbi:DUF2325 domain-containing protein [Desulfofundulus thermosubterraneus]|uniref:DUF2325 domain-containing protein n=1 Tax=Desulfofundulus thermosubterraneus DSM 16057 TaxID=1121432 RepID=A0A1M6JEN2_9FIRM|nr:DUF2325 domain-containing protein [Desulfofundulus thermosubterraneus]SHJ45169.1 hypothetical protein SAMN02745219_02591 [Desulfofundulus thermosubterraneus DSM 16057]
MRCLIVGTDRLGAAPAILRQKFGVREIVHWDGRRKKLPESFPRGTGLVVVYTGFVNHTLMHRVRELARKAGIKVVWLKRGLSELEVLSSAG